MWFGRAWNNAQTMESPSLLLTSMAWRMWTWLQWNRWQEAHQVALDILRLIEQYQQDEKRQLWALETLAMIEYQQGNAEQGDQYARQYKRLIDQQGERTEDTATTSISMRDIYLAREDWTRAATEYKEKLYSSEPLPSPEVLTTLAELMVIIGEDAEAQESMCTRALTIAEESGACKSLALAFRARGRMYIEQQKWLLAKDDLYQALQRCEALDIPWDRGITLYYIGVLYKRRASTFDKDTPNRRTTDLERARYHFEQALGFFESIHAQPSIEHVRSAMDYVGV
jgi:tetratricopeptide (TPR) repeat protein